MNESGGDAFGRLLRTYISRGIIDPDDRVFVQFAGSFDEAVCADAGLTNCSFGNLMPNTHSTGQTIAEKFDAHRMPQPDASYDHVLAHAGLHHCSRPHEALHEMYRLARKTVMFIENQDSALMRAATKAGVVSWFELPAVVDGDYVSGGVDGTGVPNFVYRWTRREVTKAVAAFDPGRNTPIDFHTEWNLGENRVSSGALARKLHLSPRRAARVLTLGERAMNQLARSQGNIFAAVIRKDLATLRPWMADDTSMARVTSSGEQGATNA